MTNREKRPSQSASDATNRKSSGCGAQFQAASWHQVPLSCFLILWENDSCDSRSREVRKGIERYTKGVSYSYCVFLAGAIPRLLCGTRTHPELASAPD
jgi:hypothetical protein